jgi:hypothetical protein
MLKLISDPVKMQLYLIESIPAPTVFHYNVVLKAWAKNKRLPPLVELMGRMKHHGVAADVNSYTIVIVALTQSGQPDYVDKADAFLAEMEELNLQPDIVHYETVLLAWDELKDAARATKVLIRRIHAATERPALAPVPANFHQNATLWMRSGNTRQAALILLRLYEFSDQGLLKMGPDERTRYLIASTLVRENKPDEYKAIIDQLNLRRQVATTTPQRMAAMPSSFAATAEASAATASSSTPTPPPPRSRNDNNNTISSNSSIHNEDFRATKPPLPHQQSA